MTRGRHAASAQAFCDSHVVHSLSEHEAAVPEGVLLDELQAGEVASLSSRARSTYSTHSSCCCCCGVGPASRI